MLEEKATFETGRTSIAEPIFRHSMVPMVPMRDIGKNYSTEGKPRKISNGWVFSYGILCVLAITLI